MFLLVGLGNPGDRYAGNRHNVGFRVAAEAARRAGASIDRVKFGARIGTGSWEGKKCAWVFPETFMNVSGEAVGPAARYFRVEPAQIAVVHDDLDLEFGDVRVKVGGGDGGHNGLGSLIQHLGPEFVRVRVGIGRPPPGWDPADYVLSDFTGSEEKQLPEVIDRAVEAARMVVAEGPSKAMNRFNRRKPSRPDDAGEPDAGGKSGSDDVPSNREEKP